MPHENFQKPQNILMLNHNILFPFCKVVWSKGHLDQLGQNGGASVWLKSSIEGLTGILHRTQGRLTRPSAPQ